MVGTITTRTLNENSILIANIRGDSLPEEIKLEGHGFDS
jgi:hypothetical protein